MDEIHIQRGLGLGKGEHTGVRVKQRGYFKGRDQDNRVMRMMYPLYFSFLPFHTR